MSFPASWTFSHVPVEAQPTADRGSIRRSLTRPDAIGTIPVAEAGVCLMLICTATIDLSRHVVIGTVTLSGLLTIAYAAFATLLLTVRSRLADGLLKRFYLLAALATLAFSSIAWCQHRTVDAVQNLSVLVSFVAVVILSADMSARSQGRTTILLRVLECSAVGAACLFAVTYGLARSITIITPRPFALYEAAALAWFMARWRSGERRYAFLTVMIFGLILASLSRTATVLVLIVMPWMIWWKGKRFSWVKPTVVTLSFAVLLAGMVFSIRPLRERFFAGDRAVEVNGTTVNTAGRTKIWAIVAADSLRSPWIGSGVGTSDNVVRREIGEQIGHPHNDYLRLFHDYGAAGLLMWLVFVVQLSRNFFRASKTARWLRASRCETAIAAGAGAMAILLGSMFTDNFFIYPGPMIITAVLLGRAAGCSVALDRADRDLCLGTQA